MPPNIIPAFLCPSSLKSTAMDLKRYREVIPNQANQEKVKEIILNTGKSR